MTDPLMGCEGNATAAAPNQAGYEVSVPGSKPGTQLSSDYSGVRMDRRVSRSVGSVGRRHLSYIIGILVVLFGAVSILMAVSHGRVYSVPLDRVTIATAHYGVSHRSAHRPHQLSGGQQQRVAMARTTVARPKLTLADEPTRNLDYMNGETVMSILGGLNREGATIVIVTHSQHHATYASRVLHMLDGVVVLEASTGTA